MTVHLVSSHIKSVDIKNAEVH